MPNVEPRLEPSLPTLFICDAGLLDYDRALALQAAARNMVERKKCAGVLILCQHPAVITFGRSGGAENLLVPEAALEAEGVLVRGVGRGGNVTCHNPGQLVAYPVLDLAAWRKDVHWYVHSLEEIVIRALAELGLTCGRKPPHTGVWRGDAKICAIGVSLKRWITGHGLALNVNNDLALFQRIVPCGIREYAVTSVRAQGVNIGPAALIPLILRHFLSPFPCRHSGASLQEIMSFYVSEPEGEAEE